MKKRKKMIVEENKGSLSKKIGKYAVIVVLYIALVSTLAFIMSTISLIVNADSINDTPDSQYMKTCYYNWDSITWRDTNGNNYVTGSNDTFSTEETWSDYYQISRDVEIEDETNYIYVENDNAGNIVTYTFDVGQATRFNQLSWPLYDLTNSSYLNVEYLYGQIRLFIGSYQGSIYNNGNVVYAPDNIVYDNVYTANVSHSGGSIGSMPGIEGPSASVSYNQKNDNIMTLSNIVLLAIETEYYTIQRNLSYNSDLSTIDTFVYDSTIISDLKFESILFEKDNFFLRVGDLNKVGSPQISVSVLNGGYDISFDIVGWVKKQDGSTQNISVNTDTREGVLGYQYLFPSKFELFGNVETITNDDMMYIESYRVLVEFSNSYVDNLSYRYGVDSLELNNINYGGALSNWVNSSIGINMGDILLNNVNAFLQFEILPNFTLFNLFVLIVAIPLLIWILKLILGG